ncbi:MAG: class B sortase [Clostridia bacterium]|nr:class B sortase [Clostridia bacterium]
MFGRKKFGNFYDDDLFLGHLEEEQKKEEKLSVDEDSGSDEIKMEHAEKPQLIKEEGSAPTRRPLANPESMPKKKAPKKPIEKKKPAFDESRPDKDKKGIFPFNVVPFKKAEEEKKAPPKPLTKEEKEKRIRDSLDGLYDVYKDPELAPEKKIATTDFLRYGLLFLFIFGFFTAGIFVFGKIYSYHRTYVINTRLQELVSSVDRFQGEYLKKSVACINSLTPQDILNGKKEETTGGDTYTEEQQNLVNKLHQLKKINGDTAGWITIDGTVVNYPVVWSEVKNYYLKHDFYGKSLSSGTIYIDERNSPNIGENRNTVIYGHNMSDGSMFASLHDFSSATLFHGATIEVATEEGIYVYKPFSAHESHAYDNYFETDFATDEEFISFCEQMAFLSLYQSDVTFDKDTRLLTLSTCKNEGGSRDRRFAVHAVLVKVIR